MGEVMGVSDYLLTHKYKVECAKLRPHNIVDAILNSYIWFYDFARVELARARGSRLTIDCACV